jgi:hypothetical protein
MSLSSAFTAAWLDLKKVATTAAAFVTKQAPVVQKVVGIASTAVEVLDPAATPIVTAFDSIEAALVGEVTAALGAITTAPDPTSFFTVSLPGTLWPALKQIEQTLIGHPAVVTAVAAALPSPA